MRFGVPRVLVALAAQWQPKPQLIGGLASIALHLAALIALACLYLPRAHRAELAILTWTDSGESNSVQPFRAAEDLTLGAGDLDDPLPALPPVDVPLAADPGAAMQRTGPLGQLAELTTAALPATWSAAPSSDGGLWAGESQDEDLAAELPASGKQAHFFGVSAQGDSFVYVLDMSTSMAQMSSYGPTRFQLAGQELLRSIEMLSDSQQFYVILFSYRTRYLFDDQGASLKMFPASAESKALARQWLQRIRLEPGTDPRMALLAALRMKPSAIFLLSDGAFNGREDVNRWLLRGNPTVEDIVARARGATPVHTVAFEDLMNRKRLRLLSQRTGGTHRFVSSMGVGNVLLQDLASPDPGEVLYALSAIVEQTDSLSDLDRRRVAQMLSRMQAVAPLEMRERVEQALRAVTAPGQAEEDEAGPASLRPLPLSTPARKAILPEPDIALPSQASLQPSARGAATRHRR